jgi:hypothetical protein
MNPVEIPPTPVALFDEDSFMSRPLSLQYAAMATLMLAASTVAAQSTYETQIRAAAGFGPDSSTAAGLRLAHESGFQGFVAEAGLNTSPRTTSFRLSWNQLADDAARTDVSRLGLGYDRDEDSRYRLTFAYTTEGDTWGWTLGAMSGNGCPCIAKSGAGSAALDRPSRYGLLGRLTYGDVSRGLRVLAGVDIERGKSARTQTTGTLMLEKYLGRSPASVSVAWEHAWLPKGAADGLSSDKVFALIRYDFTVGGSLSRRSDDDIERAALRETFHLKSFDGTYAQQRK